MNAAVYHRYGPPEVVTKQTVPLPLPKREEVLIQVHYSTVNRTDCGFRSAEYFISRLFSGLFKPSNPILGCEFSGIIVSLGSDVKDLKVGQEVFGYDDRRFGCHAEYKVISANGNIASIPKGSSLREAAALTEGSHYALSNIRAAKVIAGQRVLVNGATGAIGSAAVQILRAIGAYVVAVVPGQHVELVNRLGADKVIDYQAEDFTQLNERFHFIFDAVGKSSFARCKPLLLSQGIYSSTELGKRSENIFLALRTRRSKGQRVLFPLPVLKKAELLYLRELAEKRLFVPLIDREYTLDEIVQAHHYAESGEKLGNVLLTITNRPVRVSSMDGRTR